MTERRVAMVTGATGGLGSALATTVGLVVQAMGLVLLAMSTSLFMASLAAGMWLIFAGDQGQTSTAPDPLRGNIIGAVTGLSRARTRTR